MNRDESDSHIIDYENSHFLNRKICNHISPAKTPGDGTEQTA